MSRFFHVFLQTNFSSSWAQCLYFLKSVGDRKKSSKKKNNEEKLKFQFSKNISLSLTLTFTSLYLFLRDSLARLWNLFFFVWFILHNYWMENCSCGREIVAILFQIFSHSGDAWYFSFWPENYSIECSKVNFQFNLCESLDCMKPHSVIMTLISKSAVSRRPLKSQPGEYMYGKKEEIQFENWNLQIATEHTIQW